jgi:hypothetical protein
VPLRQQCGCPKDSERNVAGSVPNLASWAIATAVTITAASSQPVGRTWLEAQPELELSLGCRSKNPSRGDGLLRCGQTSPSPKSRKSHCSNRLQSFPAADEEVCERTLSYIR